MNAPLLPGRIEHWPLARLKPYARNAKTHDADQVAKIAASMAEFGWTVPVLVAADGELIAGHGRILAAAHLGLSEAPVIVLGHLTEAQRRAYRIADNKLNELGGWDEALLLQELQALLAEDFDLGLIGIPEDELDTLLADADDRPAISDDAADAIPAPPAEPITRPGDIWALGKHRLCCGDATDPAAVARLMHGEQATLMFTSPPYAQQRDYGAAKEKVGDWDALMQGVFTAAPVTAEAQLLVNLGLVHRDSEWQPYWEGWVEWMRASGWRRFGWYVWDQGPGLPGDWNGRLAPSHEFIFHFNRAPRKPHKTVPSKHAGETLGGGGLRGTDGNVHAKTGTGNPIQSHRIPDSVFRIMRHKGGLGAAGSHPAVFPVALVEAVLTAFSDLGDLIYEPFCGSGTQIVAAERAGRRCFAMELDPVYCDVAVRRWEMATGKVAKRFQQPCKFIKPRAVIAFSQEALDHDEDCLEFDGSNSETVGMVARADITDSEYAFLVSQKILLSHVFDARGRTATSWGEEAKREGLLFGLAEPCYQGHRLRTRAGHCIQCDTARIAYARRFAEPGYVYIAASRNEKLLKVGCCLDPEQRQRNLNFHAYGGAADWEIIAWCKTASMGHVEFDIQKQLSDLSTERSYKKDGRDQTARELFRYEISRVWQVYRQRVSRMEGRSKWQHPRLTSFSRP